MTSYHTNLLIRKTLKACKKQRVARNNITRNITEVVPHQCFRIPESRKRFGNPAWSKYYVIHSHIGKFIQKMPRTYGGGCELRLAFTYMHLPFAITLQPFSRHRPPWRWHPLACIFVLCTDATGKVKMYLKAMDKN